MLHQQKISARHPGAVWEAGLPARVGQPLTCRLQRLFLVRIAVIAVWTAIAYKVIVGCPR
jgi:hypothetical protein